MRMQEMNPKGTMLCLTMILLAAMSTISPTLAQSFPSKPIRMIVPFPPGGGADAAARIIGEKLTKSMGQSVIIENRPGADGNIGTEAIAKAAPDGYTIGIATPGPVAVGKKLFSNLPYDPEKDLTPIANLYESPLVLVVNPRVPGSTIRDLVAAANAQPGRLNIAVSTIGSAQHYLSEMLKIATHTNIQSIPYKGGPQAITDVLGGQVEMAWAVIPVVLPLINSGKLRALAISSERRSALLPSVPTMIESGYPTVVSTSWNGVIGPAGIPKGIVARISKEINLALANPDVQQRFSALGLVPLGGTPAAFEAFLRTDSANWAKLIRQAGLKPE